LYILLADKKNGNSLKTEKNQHDTRVYH